MTTAWLCLFGAVVAEVLMIATTKASEGWTKLWPTIGLLAASLTGLYLISRAVKDIPISTAYAIWTGMGGIGAAVLGMVYFEEPASVLKVVFILCILTGVVGLKAIS